MNRVSTLTDVELLAAHVANPKDPRAIGELINRHSAKLWTVAKGITRHDQDAQDALQDALSRVWVHAATYRGDASVGAWLNKIAVNAALATIARRRVHEELRPSDELFEDPAGRAVLEEVEVDHELVRALAAVPVVLRDAFLLVAYLGFSVQDAADMLGLPPGTVKSRVWRARQHLQQVIDRGLRAGNP